MKKLFLLLMALFTLAQVKAQEKSVIQISTDNTDLILQVAPNGRLYQAYLGDKLLNEQDIKHFSPYVAVTAVFLHAAGKSIRVPVPKTISNRLWLSLTATEIQVRFSAMYLPSRRP